MPLLASLFTAVWIVLAFAVRIGIQLRRHGDSGLRAGDGGPSSPAWWARVLFVAATLVVTCGPVLAALDLAEMLAPPGHRAAAVLGTILALVGIAGTFGAQLAMGASWRIGLDPAERTSLVTSGPFAVVRNPIFSAMGLTAAGLTLMAPTVVGAVGLAGLVVALEIQVRGVEEPYLLRTHGDEYRAYARRTGRFVPWPASPAANRGGPTTASPNDGEAPT